MAVLPFGAIPDVLTGQIAAARSALFARRYSPHPDSGAGLPAARQRRSIFVILRESTEGIPLRQARSRTTAWRDDDHRGVTEYCRRFAPRLAALKSARAAIADSYRVPRLAFMRKGPTRSSDQARMSMRSTIIDGDGADLVRGRMTVLPAFGDTVSIFAPASSAGRPGERATVTAVAGDRRSGRRGCSRPHARYRGQERAPWTSPSVGQHLDEQESSVGCGYAARPSRGPGRGRRAQAAALCDVNRPRHPGVDLHRSARSLEAATPADHRAPHGQRRRTRRSARKSSPDA